MSRLAMGRAAAHRLGSGGTQLLLGGSSSRLATRLPSRLTAAGPRSTRDASEWKPTRFPPPSQNPPAYPGPNYGVPPPQPPPPPPPPPGGGRPRYGKLVFILSAVAVGVYFVSPREWPSWLPKIRLPDIQFPSITFGISDEAEAQFWSGGKIALQGLEAKAEEPFRTLYREAHQAVAKKDWAEVRRALAEAWKATEGAKDSRLAAFDPVLIRLLFKLHFEHDMKVGGHPENLVRFAEEVLPAMDHARALPLRPQGADPISWGWLFFNSLGLRAMTASAIMRTSERPVSQSSLAEAIGKRADAFLQPAREEVIALMEEVRTRGSHNFDETDRNSIVAYCDYIHRTTSLTHRYLDAVRFCRYRVMILDMSSRLQAADGLFDLADSILHYLEDLDTKSLQQQAEKTNPPESNTRPEFQDPQSVLTMPLEQLASGNDGELVHAVKEIANVGLAALSQVTESGRERDLVEAQGFILGAKVATINGDPVQGRDFLEKAEKAAKRFAWRTGETGLLRNIQDLKGAVASGARPFGVRQTTSITTISRPK